MEGPGELGVTPITNRKEANFDSDCYSIDQHSQQAYEQQTVQPDTSSLEG
jgi:hypothetical protein